MSLLFLGRLVIATALLFSAPSLYAQLSEEERESEQEREQESSPFRGLFLRLYGGLGLFTKFIVLYKDAEIPYPPDYKNKENEGDEAYTLYNQPAPNFQLQLGYLIYDPYSPTDVFLYTGYSIIQARLRRKGELLQIAQKGTLRYEMPIFSLGGGLFFKNFNTYIAYELRFDANTTEFNYEYKRQSDGSRVGQRLSTFGIGLTIGKDWRLSPHFLLGLALFYYIDNSSSSRVVIRNSQYGRQNTERLMQGASQYLGLALSVTVN